MLPRVGSLEHLIVAREQRLAEDLGVPAIKRRFDRRRRDCDAGMTRLDDRILAIIALLRGATANDHEKEKSPHPQYYESKNRNTMLYAVRFAGASRIYFFSKIAMYWLPLT